MVSTMVLSNLANPAATKLSCSLKGALVMASFDITHQMNEALLLRTIHGLVGSVEVRNHDALKPTQHILQYCWISVGRVQIGDVCHVGCVTAAMARPRLALAAFNSVATVLLGHGNLECFGRSITATDEADISSAAAAFDELAMIVAVFKPRVPTAILY